MSTYIQSILVTLAISQFLLVLASELWGEHTQKFLRIICGTVMILTLFSPIKGVVESIKSDASRIPEETEPADESETIKMRTEAVMEATCAYIAEEWFSYITEIYDIKRSQIRIVFKTDEQMRILSAEIILSDCPYALRRKIEQEMTTETDFTIIVRGE